MFVQRLRFVYQSGLESGPMTDHSRMLSRRSVLASMAALPTLAVAQSPEPKVTERTRAALKDAKGTKLVLLGTGAGPVPGRSRRMTSNVILSNGAAYVVDCGLGVTDQFASIGIPFGAVRSVFITHHHPDHNIEYGPLLVIGWVQGMPPSVQATLGQIMAKPSGGARPSMRIAWTRGRRRLIF
jgi:hypothetical protein